MLAAYRKKQPRHAALPSVLHARIGAPERMHARMRATLPPSPQLAAVPISSAAMLLAAMPLPAKRQLWRVHMHVAWCALAVACLHACCVCAGQSQHVSARDSLLSVLGSAQQHVHLCRLTATCGRCIGARTLAQPATCSWMFMCGLHQVVVNLSITGDPRQTHTPKPRNGVPRIPPIHTAPA